MKIIDWFKNLLSRLSKKDNLLNEGSSEIYEQHGKKDFVPKVDINTVENPKSREDILMSLREDIIIMDFSEQYNYSKFSPENIRKNYDKDAILSDEDNTALSCLFGAIKYGNTQEFLNSAKRSDNKINAFLKESPNNIVVLINLMIKEAKTSYEKLMSNPDQSMKPKSVQGLIPGSYSDILSIIEEYNKEKETNVEK